MKDGSGYLTYFRYSKVKEILGKKQYTAEQLLKKTKIPQASLYRILKGLLVNKEIVMLETKKLDKCGRLLKIYELKRGKE